MASPANANVEGAAEQLGKLGFKSEPRPKCKQIDVLQEYEKADKDKKSASFVVVGKWPTAWLGSFNSSNYTFLTCRIRARRCGEEYVDGPFTIRAQVCGQNYG